MKIFMFVFLISVKAFSFSVIARLKNSRTIPIKSFLNYEPIIHDLNIVEIQLPSVMKYSDAYDLLEKDDNILYFQKNHKVSKRVLPNDELIDDLWNFAGNSHNADINITGVWDRSVGGTDALGNDIVIAVVDGGVDVKHKDLKDNIWVNRDEIPNNNKDDDQNGYIDDVNGFNAATEDGNISADFHGSHVAGIMGAVGNNSLGVTGVNWKANIITVSLYDYDTKEVLKGYGYLLSQKKLWLKSNGKKGANIVVSNSSFGIDRADCNSQDYPLWNDIYNEMGKAGILSIAATINSNVNIDEAGDVPTGCSSDYIIAVTNTESTNVKYKDSGWGVKGIDLGAPGTDIYSTIPNNRYTKMTGTSMSTPHVTGAVGLLYSLAGKNFIQTYIEKPGTAALKLKKAILDSVEPLDSLKGKTKTGGKLNVQGAYEKLVNLESNL